MRGVLCASVVISWMHSIVCKRVDVAHAVSIVSWFLSNLAKKHQITVKWILRCLIGTLRTCLCFGCAEESWISTWKMESGCVHDFEYNNINELNFCYTHVASVKQRWGSIKFRIYIVHFAWSIMNSLYISLL